jgi:type IV secretory pathway TraG/TraD family ATPase VirD4
VHQNLANVFKILETLAGEPEVIDSYFADTTPKHLWQKFLSVMGNSENTRASIISSAQASLSFIGDDQTLCDITSVDTFDFDELREENTVLFLRCSLSDMSYYSTILSIFFEQFFAHVFKVLPKKEDNNVFVMIDELSSLHLPNLANIISNSRKFNCPFLGVLQSENQLAQNYGEYNAKTILNNANTKVYFTGLSDESKAISDTLGDFEYEDDKGIIRKRNLMTRDEVRTMRKDQVIVIPSRMRPMICKTHPYYKQSRLVRYMEMEAPENHEEILFDYTVQYLDFDKYHTQKETSNQNTSEDEV